MEYIDKAAVMAEIEKIIPQRTYERETLHSEFVRGQRVAYNKILSFLGTLEAKDVDLEEELNDFIEQQKAWIKDNRIVEYYNGDSFNHIYDLEQIAKHFFELGIKAAQKEK